MDTDHSSNSQFKILNYCFLGLEFVTQIMNIGFQEAKGCLELLELGRKKFYNGALPSLIEVINREVLSSYTEGVEGEFLKSEA